MMSWKGCGYGPHWDTILVFWRGHLMKTTNPWLIFAGVPLGVHTCICRLQVTGFVVRVSFPITSPEGMWHSCKNAQLNMWHFSPITCSFFRSEDRWHKRLLSAKSLILIEILLLLKQVTFGIFWQPTPYKTHKLHFFSFGTFISD